MVPNQKVDFIIAIFNYKSYRRIIAKLFCTYVACRFCRISVYTLYFGITFI